MVNRVLHFFITVRTFVSDILPHKQTLKLSCQDLLRHKRAALPRSLNYWPIRNHMLFAMYEYISVYKYTLALSIFSVCLCIPLMITNKLNMQNPKLCWMEQFLFSTQVSPSNSTGYLKYEQTKEEESWRCSLKVMGKWLTVQWWITVEI